MNDVFFFLQQGWKSIWKQRTIWLFSALPFISDFLFPFVERQGVNLSGAANSLAASMISMILLAVEVIAVPYLAYSFFTGKPVTIRETFSAVGHFGVRVLLTGCLGLLSIAPCIVLVLVISLDRSTQPPQLFNRFYVLLLPLSLLSAMFYFPMFEFFAKDHSIRQSIKEAWTLFTSHFRVLGTLGITMTLVYSVFSLAAGLLTVLLQSGFDVAALRTLNYINPAASLHGNLLFLFFVGVAQIIYTALAASVFVLAYLKYSEEKQPLPGKTTL
jgi:hypothetical protein